MQAAKLDVGEVTAVLGNSLMRANQLEHYKFLVPEKNAGIIGSVDFGVRLFQPVRKSNQQKLKLQTEFDPRVTVWESQPWNDTGFVRQSLKSGLKGLIITSKQNSTSLKKIKPILKLLAENRVLVVFPQSELKKKLELPNNVVFTDQMTIDTLQIKMMWVLAQKQKLSEQKKALLVNMHNEFIK